MKAGGYDFLPVMMHAARYGRALTNNDLWLSFQSCVRVGLVCTAGASHTFKLLDRTLIEGGLCWQRSQNQHACTWANVSGPVGVTAIHHAPPSLFYANR